MSQLLQWSFNTENVEIIAQIVIWYVYFLHSWFLSILELFTYFLNKLKVWLSMELFLSIFNTTSFLSNVQFHAIFEYDASRNERGYEFTNVLKASSIKFINKCLSINMIFFNNRTYNILMFCHRNMDTKFH